MPLPVLLERIALVQREQEKLAFAPASAWQRGGGQQAAQLASAILWCEFDTDLDGVVRRDEVAFPLVSFRRERRRDAAAAQSEQDRVLHPPPQIRRGIGRVGGAKARVTMKGSVRANEEMK